METERRIIVLNEFLPKGAKHDCEQGAEDLVEAHEATLNDTDWTLDDDLELKTYTSQMESICRKDKDQGRNKSPSNIRLYLNLNDGPQYVTRAALLFLQTIYKTCPQLAAFQEAAEEFGFAPPKKEGFHRTLNDTTFRPAPKGWPSNEKLTKHYVDIVSNARKSPGKKSPAKRSTVSKDSSRGSTPGLLEERKPSVEPRTNVSVRLSPHAAEVETMTDKDVDVSMADASIDVEIETTETDVEMGLSPVSPKKRNRTDDITPPSLITTKAQEAPSPEKRRKMPVASDRSRNGSPMLGLSVNKTKAPIKLALQNDSKLPDLSTLNDKFSDILPKKRTLPELPASKLTEPTAQPNSVLRARAASKQAGNTDKEKTNDLPDLELLDQVHAKTKDAHDAVMKKLTDEINELTMREKKAAQELLETKDRVARMGEEVLVLVKEKTEQEALDVKSHVSNMQEQIETLAKELESAKMSQHRLETYVGRLVNRLVEAGSLVV